MVEITITTNEITVPAEVSERVIIDLRFEWLLLDWINFSLTLLNLTTLAIYLQQKSDHKMHLWLVLSWLINNAIYSTAVLLNRAEWFTIEYSSLFFLKWQAVLRLHILVAGAVLLLRTFVKDKWRGLKRLG
jgi:hypothetical protein